MIKVKKTLAITLSVVLIITSTPPREVEASWFSDLMGGIFTVITSPILLFAKDNPTLRKNNPFRKKVWEEEEEKEERKRDKEIIKRLSSHVEPPPQQTIVIEKTVEVVKDNSAEIDELKKEVAAMKHVVANVRNGRDGRDGKDAEISFDLPKQLRDLKLQDEYQVVKVGNTTRIISPQRIAAAKAATMKKKMDDDQDQRKLESIVMADGAIQILKFLIHTQKAFDLFVYHRTLYQACKVTLFVASCGVKFAGAMYARNRFDVGKIGDHIKNVLHWDSFKTAGLGCLAYIKNCWTGKIENPETKIKGE
jgi:hypothetical protein